MRAAQIKFRLVLPLAMTALSIVLFCLSLLLRPQELTNRPPSPAVDDKDENGTVTFSPEPELKLSPTLKVELALNLPAVQFGGLALEVIRAVTIGGGSESSLIGFSTLFVPLLWFSIGRWIDRQRSFIGLETVISRVREMHFKALLRFIAAIGLLGAICGLLPTYHHRTAESDFYFLVIGIWSTVYLTCSIWGARRLVGLHQVP